MADESIVFEELDDGELVPSVVNGLPSAAAAEIQLRAQLHEAVQDLRHRGQPNLAQLAFALVVLDLRDAMWVLSDRVRGGGGFYGDPALYDAFRHVMRERFLSLQEAGYDEHVVSEAVLPMVLEAAQLAVAGRLRLDSGGFGAVPASAAAVRRLKKQTFVRAAAGAKDESVGEGITQCSICFEDFVDGAKVSVMPCPSRGHNCHPDCINNWLGISNMCPLCRHVLPAH